jgi:hypothetical protein
MILKKNNKKCDRQTDKVTLHSTFYKQLSQLFYTYAKGYIQHTVQPVLTYVSVSLTHTCPQTGLYGEWTGAVCHVGDRSGTSFAHSTSVVCQGQTRHIAKMTCVACLLK